MILSEGTEHHAHLDQLHFQRLIPFHLHSRLVQTRECLRIANESSSGLLYDRVCVDQLGHLVIRRLKAFANTEDRKRQREACTTPRERLHPYLKIAYSRLYGWRRLTDKLSFEGSLDDLVEFMRFVDRQISLATHLIRNQAGKFNLFVGRYELISLSTQKKHFFNITELLRK